MYLNRVTVIEDLAPLKAGLDINFTKPICFLVGNNGIGKSTVLDCLAEKFKFVDDTYFKRRGSSKNIVIEKEADFPVRYIDFHGHDRKFSAAFGSDMGLQMTQMRCSSGEVSISLINQIGGFKDGLIMLDEPERGLSIKNQFRTVQIIRGFQTKFNCQFVVTTHSDIVLKNFKDEAQYFSIAENADVSYEDFMISQLV